jgi:hypothetical protein
LNVGGRDHIVIAECDGFHCSVCFLRSVQG